MLGRLTRTRNPFPTPLSATGPGGESTPVHPPLPKRGRLAMPTTSADGRLKPLCASGPVAAAGRVRSSYRRWRLTRLSASGLVAALVLLVGMAGPAQAQMTCDPCVIGVALDGPWERNDEVRLGFEREIADLVGPRFTAVFPVEKRRVADWTLAGARGAVDALLADPAVDLVLTAGPVVSSTLVGRGEPPKPVVALFVLGPEAQGFPLAVDEWDDRVSGVPNLSYLTFGGDASNELRRFRELAPFTRLTYVSHAGLGAVAPLEAELRNAAASLGVELEAVRAESSVDAVLAAIGPDAEAIYLAPLRQLPPGGFDRLVHALRDRGLPTFSWWGQSDVQRGVLAGTYLEADFQRLGRRIALHVQRILTGEDAGALPIDFERSRRLTLNIETARTIGVSPTADVVMGADVLQARGAAARSLDLATAAREAVSANLDLAAFEQVLAAGRQNARAARAAWRPQVTASTRAETPDSDVLVRALGIEPAWLAAGTVGVSQLLYSEAAQAEVQIQDHLQRAREQAREELRLDVVRDAAVGHLDVLRTQALERIERDNLTLTWSHLDLAESRRRIGVARPSEVVRWESQIAVDRRALVAAGARRRVAEIALNRLLARPLDETFEATDVAPNDPELLAMVSRLDASAGNPAAFECYLAFMVAEGRANSPELLGIDAAIDARERGVRAARRAWTPTVAAHGNLIGVGRDDIGVLLDDEATRALPFAFAPTAFTWAVGVSAVMPLFDGGARRANRLRAARELDELRITRRATADRVEQRVRSALRLAGASWVGIDLAASAAASAGSSLALVTDAYAEGSVSIVDLIDAQQAALAGRRLEAEARYDFLVDLMRVQRAIGRFFFFMEPAQVAEFSARLGDRCDATRRRRR